MQIDSIENRQQNSTDGIFFIWQMIDAGQYQYFL